MIKLAEPLFVSFQGEGKNQGKMALFIRFASCNLTCKICDTKYSWTEEFIEKSEEQLFETINSFINNQIDLIVITGGEPLYQNQDFIIELIKSYPNINFDIETNGTIVVKKELLQLKNINFVISPKVNIEQINDIEGITIPYLLNQLLDNQINNYIIKFLFNSKEDLDEILILKKLFNLDSTKIWVQPIAINMQDILNKIKDNYLFILQNRLNISFRLHCFLFSNKKGV